MAKEQLHSWAKTITILCGIVFAGGGYVMKINSNSTAIADVKVESRTDHEKVCSEVDSIKNDVVDLKLQYKDIENLSESTLKALTDIKSSVDSANTTQQAIRTDIEVMKVKMETLIKD